MDGIRVDMGGFLAGQNAPLLFIIDYHVLIDL